MRGCLEEGHDLSRGLKYNNLGIHGAGSANAADALAAGTQFVFDEQTESADELLADEVARAHRRYLVDYGQSH